MLLTWFDLFKGEIAALSGAILWAGAAVVYTRFGQLLSPLVLNAVKGTIAIALLLLTLALRGTGAGALDPSATGLLLLSGLVGIGIGDTAYFTSLNLLGARRTLLLETLAPLIAAFIALIWLGEQLNPLAWCGIALALAGVAWAIAERAPIEAAQNPTVPWLGIGVGVFSALAQASGAVLARAALVNSDISPLWSALLRLSAGTLVLFPPIAIRRQLPQLLKPFQSRRLLLGLSLTAFISTYLGVWLQQTAFKFTAAGIAQTLLATSPIFVLPIALWQGEKVSLRAGLGAAIALAGIALLFSGR